MELAYDRTGSGPPLVLVHPLGTDRHVWDPVIPELARQRTVIAVDLPGHGESAPLTAVTPAPPALAEAVAVQLARLDVPRPHVAGNSLGGWVALELGLRGRAASVTAIAPAGLWSRPLAPKASVGHRLAHALEPLTVALAATGPGRDLLLRGSVAHPRRMPSRDARHLARAYARTSGFVAVNDAMRASTFAGLERIHCPVTLVWPEHDRLVRHPKWLPATVDDVALPDAGHIPMWDAPEAVAALLLAGSRERYAGARSDP